nr:transcription factor bHLH71-like [Ipomoea batatas]GMD99179.1 transcription factor bHLH71-like [Ipomoea batatas]
MALEALSTTPCNNDPFNFIFYDATLSAGAGAGNNAFFSENACPEIQDLTAGGVGGGLNGGCSAVVCKNKEEAETQRMTHIAVERNRRKQMNEHLAVLRSLMPESYVQRGDQASIVGGAIEFVKELEHLLQSLEAEKLRLQRQQQPAAGDGASGSGVKGSSFTTNPFWQFFAYPQYTCSSPPLIPNKCTSKTSAAAADIEVTLIETHANVRILSPRRKARQLSKMVAAFQTIMCMSVLHLNVTTFDLLVLYSISAKVEGGCQLSSADEIAEAVHHILRGIEEEELTIP